MIGSKEFDAELEKTFWNPSYSSSLRTFLQKPSGHGILFIYCDETMVFYNTSIHENYYRLLKAEFLYNDAIPHSLNRELKFSGDVTLTIFLGKICSPIQYDEFIKTGKILFDLQYRMVTLIALYSWYNTYLGKNYML